MSSPASRALAPPPFRADLSPLDVTLDLAEVYEGVRLPPPDADERRFPRG